jgi:plastocyanin
MLALAGCGSSESGGSSAGSAAATAATASTAASATGAHTSSTHAHSELKADTTPKYASPSPSEAPKAGTIQIVYRNFAIDPDTARAKVGATVRWLNENPQKCNVTSEGGPYRLDSGEIAAEGGSYELKLTKPGVIHYECTAYPVTMNGTIEVVE